MKVVVSKNSINGQMDVPSSKSHTIRAVAIATLAEGTSVINNPLFSKDGLAALKAAKMFGANCIIDINKWIIEGGNIKVPDDVIDVENSGTTLYFMTAIASLLEDKTIFTGDSSIRKRPILPLLDALGNLGANSYITRSYIDSPPFIINGPIKAGKIKVSGTPSQYISSLLLVAPMSEGLTRIETDNPTETPYIDMTIDWMKRSGVDVHYDEKKYSFFEVQGKQTYKNFNRTIPSDWSAVAFPLSAGLSKGSYLTINNLDFQDKQGDSKIVDILIEMGADIKINKEENKLTIVGGRTLKGINIDCSNTPDAVPILAVLGSIAEGVTILDNVAGVRTKETDRVEVMELELKKMGAMIKSEYNKMIIYGGRSLTGAEVESHDDHRVAMALSVAGLYAKGSTTVNNAECVDVSFPNFYESLNQIGARIEIID